jgi:hypothetical protein
MMSLSIVCSVSIARAVSERVYYPLAVAKHATGEAVEECATGLRTPRIERRASAPLAHCASTRSALHLDACTLLYSSTLGLARRRPAERIIGVIGPRTHPALQAAAGNTVLGGLGGPWFGHDRYGGRTATIKAHAINTRASVSNRDRYGGLAARVPRLPTYQAVVADALESTQARMYLIAPARCAVWTVKVSVVFTCSNSNTKSGGC